MAQAFSKQVTTKSSKYYNILSVNLPDQKVGIVSIGAFGAQIASLRDGTASALAKIVAHRLDQVLGPNKLLLCHSQCELQLSHLGSCIFKKVLPEPSPV